MSWLLPRLVGVGRAHEMMLTGRFVDAGEACRIGLVTEVVADDRLQDAVLGKAGEIIARSAFAVALTKEGMWAAVETPGLHAAMVLEDRQQAIGLVSADHQAAVREFLSRAAPDSSTGRSS